MRIDKTMRHHSAGFTLVELLVVIGIIALLIAILLPVLRKAKEAANTVVCSTQQKQLLAAFIMYTQDNKGQLGIPPEIGNKFDPNSASWKNNSLMYYMDPVWPYLIRYDVGALWPYLSRGANKNPDQNTVKVAPQFLERIMSCPSDPPDSRVVYLNQGQITSYRRNFSYSWNVQIYLDSPRIHTPPQPDDIIPVHKMTQIRSSSHKILLLEERAPNDGVCWIHFILNDADDAPAFRHNGRGDFGFADGHVETLDPTQIGWQRNLTNSLIQPPSHPLDPAKNNYYFMLDVDQ